MRSSLVGVMAVASGATVANLYYNQPLLSKLQESAGVTVGDIGLIPMATQLGYALAMLLLVPLGDRLERKRLVLVMMALSAATLLGFSLMPTLPGMVFFSLLVGVTSVVPQLLVPFAAHLARPEERGKVVGIVMSGLLIGILLARTVSGFLGAALGWQAVFRLAAALMVVLGVVLEWTLPRAEPSFRGSYLSLLHSTWELVKTQPVLRESSVMGAMLFGAFSAFWANLIFLMEGAPFQLGSRAVGLFGLLGVVGALAAPIAGKLADRRDARVTVGVGIALTIVSFGIFFVLRESLAGLVVGVLLMDFGVQAGHVSNQTRVFALSHEARSRLNTAYMFSYFIGGALGTWLGSQGWTHLGWSGVCGAALLLLGVAAAVFVSRATPARPAP